MRYTIKTLAKVARNDNPDIALKLLLEQGQAQLELAKVFIDTWRGGEPEPFATDEEAAELLREIPLVVRPKTAEPDLAQAAIDIKSNRVADAILLALLKRDEQKADRLAADWLAQWAKLYTEEDPRPITLADGRALNATLKETVAGLTGHLTRLDAALEGDREAAKECIKTLEAALSAR